MGISLSTYFLQQDQSTTILKSGITGSDLLMPRTLCQPFFGPTGSCGAFQGLGKQACRLCPAGTGPEYHSHVLQYMVALNPPSFYCPSPPFSSPPAISTQDSMIHCSNHSLHTPSTFWPHSFYCGLTGCANYYIMAFQLQNHHLHSAL